MNKKQIIEQARQQGKSDVQIKRALRALGMNDNLEAELSAAEYETRYDAIMTRFKNTLNKAQQEIAAATNQMNAAILALDSEFGMSPDTQTDDNEAARAIHYPKCWDTTFYPTAQDALETMKINGVDIHEFKCANPNCIYELDNSGDGRADLSAAPAQNNAQSAAE